jgi:hypothetical protein
MKSIINSALVLTLMLPVVASANADDSVQVQRELNDAAILAVRQNHYANLSQEAKVAHLKSLAKTEHAQQSLVSRGVNKAKLSMRAARYYVTSAGSRVAGAFRGAKTYVASKWNNVPGVAKTAVKAAVGTAVIAGVVYGVNYLYKKYKKAPVVKKQLKRKKVVSVRRLA